MKSARNILLVALVYASGCASCGDNNETNNATNNATNNGTTPTNNGTTPTNNGTTPTNNGTIPNNGIPEECTPDYEFDNWDVTTDRRLIKACSPFVVDGDVNVGMGATITIDPGVEIQMASGTWFRVGGTGDGRIVANGTEEEPIIFTAQELNRAPGGWHGVRFGADVAIMSELSWVEFWYGGEEGFSTRGCLTADNDARADAVSLTNATFDSCAIGGLSSQNDVFSELSDLTFRNIEGHGIELGADAVGAVTNAFTYENVPFNRISTVDVTESATWMAQDVPYRAAQSIEVRGEDSPVLTLGAGLTLQFAGNEWLRVAGGNPGGLVVAGADGNPVVLESSADAPAAGSWLGVRLDPDTLMGTSIDAAVIRHGGEDAFSQRGCLTIDHATEGRIAVTNTVFEECAQSGVSARQEGFGFADFTGNTFRNSPHGVDLSPNAVSTIAAQTYDNVPLNRIDAKELTRSGTWVAQDVPYHVAGSIEVRGENSPVLTIEAGGVYRFDGNEWLRVGSGSAGQLVVLGTETDPVTFESFQATPAAGDWLGLRLDADTMSGTSLDHAVVRHGGEDAFSQRGCVTVDNVPAGRVSITNSTFESCLQSGVSARAEGSGFLAFSANTFADSPYGMNFSPNAISTVEDGQTYTNVPANLVQDGELTETGTWVKQSVPWDVSGSIEVRGMNQPILTLEAGTTLRFEATEWLRVGSGQPGGLVATGNAVDPVIFTSRQPTPAAGSWLGLRFDADTLNGTVVDYCVVEYAGEAAFSQRGGITLDNTGTAVAISNCVLRNNLQTDIWVDAGSTPTLTGNSGTVSGP